MPNFIYKISENSNYLIHHGIKGQEWGVQNGPPYPLNPSKDYSSAEKKANSISKNSSDKIEDQDLLTRQKVKGTLYDSSKGVFYNDWTSREISASNLGLKALNITRGDKFGYDPKKGISDLDREWFFFEDQTDGCGIIADLVNQGKSKKQILSYIDQAVKKEEKDSYKNPYTELAIVYKPSEFIDACIKVKNDEFLAHQGGKSHMQYYIMDQDYLAHYGIKGQKWGERRFQNEDGSLTPEGKRRYDQYTKDFGEKTARRMMNQMNRGVSDQKVFKREYDRRKSIVRNKILPKAIPTAAGTLSGSAIGAATGYGIGKKISKTLMPVPSPIRILPFVSGGVGSVVGGIVGTVKGYKAKSIPTGYSDYELSPEGLNYFYNKTNLHYFR